MRPATYAHYMLPCCWRQGRIIVTLTARQHQHCRVRAECRAAHIKQGSISCGPRVAVAHAGAAGSGLSTLPWVLPFNQVLPFDRIRGCWGLSFNLSTGSLRGAPHLAIRSLTSSRPPSREAMCRADVPVLGCCVCVRARVGISAGLRAWVCMRAGVFVRARLSAYVRACERERECVCARV